MSCRRRRRPCRDQPPGRRGRSSGFQRLAVQSRACLLRDACRLRAALVRVQRGGQLRLDALGVPPEPADAGRPARGLSDLRLQGFQVGRRRPPQVRRHFACPRSSSASRVPVRRVVRLGRVTDGNIGDRHVHSAHPPRHRLTARSTSCAPRLRRGRPQASGGRVGVTVTTSPTSSAPRAAARSGEPPHRRELGLSGTTSAFRRASAASACSLDAADSCSSKSIFLLTSAWRLAASSSAVRTANARSRSVQRASRSPGVLSLSASSATLLARARAFDLCLQLPFGAVAQRRPESGPAGTAAMACCASFSRAVGSGLSKLELLAGHRLGHLSVGLCGSRLLFRSLQDVRGSVGRCPGLVTPACSRCRCLLVEILQPPLRREHIIAQLFDAASRPRSRCGRSRPRRSVRGRLLRERLHLGEELGGADIRFIAPSLAPQRAPAAASPHLPSHRRASEAAPSRPCDSFSRSAAALNTLPLAVLFAPLSVYASSRRAWVRAAAPRTAGSCATACNAAAIRSLPLPVRIVLQAVREHRRHVGLRGQQHGRQEALRQALGAAAPPGSGMPQRRISRSLASTFRARSTSSKSTPFLDSSRTREPPLPKLLPDPPDTAAPPSRTSSRRPDRPPPVHGNVLLAVRRRVRQQQRQADGVGQRRLAEVVGPVQHVQARAELDVRPRRSPAKSVTRSRCSLIARAPRAPPGPCSSL